jgi:flagellar basal body-associated protein FliL
MRESARPGRRASRWVWILVAVLVLATAVYGIFHAVGSRPAKQELDRSVDTITSALGKALTLRHQERSGEASAAQVQVELEKVKNDLEDVATAMAHARPEPGLLQTYQRAAHLADNAAKQVNALASNAPADSLDRTEARLRAMHAAAGKLRAAAASLRGNSR